MESNILILSKLKNKVNFQSTASMIVGLSGAQLYGNAIRLVSGFIIAKLLLPEMLGVFNGFALILGYLIVAQLGIMNALNRELPYLIGKGQRDTALKYASTAQWWEIFLSIISFVVLFSISIYYFYNKNYIYAAGLITFAIAAVYQFYGVNYLQILYRTNGDFNKLSLNSIIVSTIGLIGVLFVWKWAFGGLCLRYIINNLVELLLLWKWKPISVKPVFDKVVFKQLLQIGLPIFFVGIIFSLWGTLHDTLLLKIGGAKNLGLYALTTMILASLTIVSNTINQVIYPKLSLLYGQGKTILELYKIPVAPLKVYMLLIIPTVVGLYFIIPYLVHYLLPQYNEGIYVAQWSLALLIINGFSVYNLIFNVIKRQKDYFVSIAVGIIVFVVFLLLLNMNWGFKLIYFPIAMIAGRIIQLVIAYLFLKSYLKIID